MSISAYILLTVFFIVIIAPLAYVAYLVYLLHQLTWATKQARRHTICPACHRVISVTWFRCHRCNQPHELIPTEGEVFHKQCSCGEKLPKVPQHGRDKLIALCPYHKPNYYPIGKYTGKHPDVIIPIVGGTSTGKSAFLAAWTVYAQGQLQFEYGVDVTFPFDGGPEYAVNCFQRFQKGAAPDKTSITNPIGLGMDIVSRTSRKGMRVFLYDPTGEAFDSMNRDSENALSHFKYYDFMDGVIFVIDPFSLPVLQRKYSQSELNKCGLVASDKQTGDTCEKFIRGLYEHNLSRNEYHYAPCAVVITKADAFDLDSLIGETAARKKMAADPHLSFDEALDEICSLQLEGWGMGRILKLLENHFSEVRCFSVSAFGHRPQSGVPFTPKRIELPILWLLKKQRQRIFVSR